jgi:FG-GAP repeat
VLERTLIGPDPTNVGSLGWSVDQSGSRIAAGAPFYDKGLLSYGAVFVYESTEGWPQPNPIFALDGKPNDNFGFSVAIDGDRLAVGARLHDGAGVNSGGVYLFEYQSGAWQQVQKLLPPDPTGAGEFGRALQLEGARLLVGAPGAISVGGKKGGAVYAYRLGPQGFALESKLSASNAEVGDAFGIHLDLAGDRLAVGACYHDSAGKDDGAVYLFDYVGDWWIESAQVLTADPLSVALGGWSTNLAGDQLLVGGLTDYGQGTGAPGSVQVYALATNQACGAANYAQSAKNFLSLVASPAKPGQTLFVSLLGQGAPAGQIWLSAAPGKLELPFGELAIDLSTAVSIPTVPLQSVFFGAIPLPGSATLIGKSLYLQGLGLEANPANWHLSHGLRVTVCP